MRHLFRFEPTKHTPCPPPTVVALAIALLTPLTACSSDGGDGPTAPETGALEVRVATTGADEGADGYRVVVDESRSEAVDANGTVTFRDLSAGDHTVELQDVVDRCDVEDANPRTIAVTGGSTARTDFSVTCAPLGEVTSITVSPDELTVKAGRRVTVEADVWDEDGNRVTGHEVAWSTSDETIARVTDAGVVVGEGEGTATITAAVGDVSSSATATVPRPVEWAVLDAGTFFTCGVTTEGKAYCWGDGPTGQLGSAAFVGLVPTAVAGEHTFETISGGSFHACALTPAGEAWCWGLNNAGQLGIGEDEAPDSCGGEEGRCAQTPQRVVHGHTFSAIELGRLSGCALTPDGEAWCWGNHRQGALGIGGPNGGESPEPVQVTGGLAFRRIAAGGNAVCALTAADEAYCWGGGTPAPETAAEDLSVREINTGGDFNQEGGGASRSTCAVTSVGEAYCWGDVASGSASPVVVPGDHTFTEAAIGWRFSCGLTADGEVLCWGGNTEGQLGRGFRDNETRAEPAPIERDLEFRSITASGPHACGITVDGAAYCWGRGEEGQLGDGIRTTRPEPVRVADPD